MGYFTHMEECENSDTRLLNDLVQFPYLDEFLRAMFAGKTKTDCLNVRVTVGGEPFDLRSAKILNEEACSKCFEKLAKLPKRRRHIIQDKGYIQWDPFERELYINLDRAPTVHL